MDMKKREQAMKDARLLAKANEIKSDASRVAAARKAAGQIDHPAMKRVANPDFMSPVRKAASAKTKQNKFNVFSKLP
jgi:hypothetical protein